MTASVKRSVSITSGCSSGSGSGGTWNDLLMCDICLEPYNDKTHEAKFLACHHSFCRACMQQLASSLGTSGPAGGSSNTASGAATPTVLVIECPTCRHKTELPENGVDGLQTNFYIAHMRETLSKLTTVPKIKGCQKHSNQPLSFFCGKCGTPICRDCTVLDHKESVGHIIKDITVAENEQRKALTEKMEEGKAALQTLQNHMQYLESELGNLTSAKETALHELDGTFDRCLKLLEFRKLQLAKQVFDRYNVKQEKLVARGEEVNKAMKILTTLITHCERLFKAGPLTDVVKVNRNLSNAVDDSKNKISVVDLGKNYVLFDTKGGLSSLEQGISQLGKVSSDGFLPTSAKITTKSEYTTCIKGTVTMQVLSHTGEPLKDYPMTVNITDPQKSKIPCEVTAIDSGKYIITFLPQISGEHELVAVFLNKPIKGSETTITVKSNNPVMKYGGQGSGSGKFLSPRAVAVEKDGNFFVADTGNRLIQKISPTGEFVTQFCVNNNKENSSTCDLALNQSKGQIVCTETIIGSGINPTMGNNVLVYSTDGTIQDIFTNKVMKCALCIATNSKGNIIVSDYLVHSLFMYDDKGGFIRRVGHAGTFNHPAFICVGNDDCIIVSDTNNDCVQIFDKEGTFVSQFGTSGNGKGQLKQPFGVATDGELILVVDSGNKRIQVFKIDGTFVSMIESKDDPLNQPRGIAMAKDGCVYVADRDNHCVKKYRYK